MDIVKHNQKDSTGIVVKIQVKLDYSQEGLENISRDAFPCQNCWVSIERSEANTRIRTNKDTFPVINKTQFPLMLASCCTVHKWQGISLENDVISFDLLRQRNFLLLVHHLFHTNN